MPPQSQMFYRPRQVMPPGAMPGQNQSMPPDIQQLIDEAIKEYASKGAPAQSATASAGSTAGAAGAGGAVASQMGGGALASTPAANAAWNSAAMGGETLPEVTLGEGSLAALAPYVGAAAGTYLVGKGVNDIRKGRTDNSAKGKAARAQTAWTTGGISEGVKKLTGGKNSGQKGRDSNRSVGMDKGVYDKDYNYTRLDGVTKNLGLDGSKGQYNVDFENDKAAVDLIPWLDPLSEVIAGGDAKRRSDQTGEFANILKDSKDPQAEIRALYDKFGVTPDMFKDLKTEDNRGDVYRNSVGQVFNGQMQKPTSSMPTEKPTTGQGLNTLPGVFEKPINIMPTTNNPNFLQQIPLPINKGPLMLNKPANNPNSPGFKDGKKIDLSKRK